MPSQKNSGKKGMKKEPKGQIKNTKFISELISEFNSAGKIPVHIGRIMRKFGNGRVEVFYVEDDRATFNQAILKGKLRVEPNSIVVLSEDDDISGSCKFQVVASFSREQISKISDKIDRRILALDITDKDQLSSCIKEEFDFEEPDIDNI